MRDAGQAVGQLLFFVLLIGGVIWLVIHLSRRNKTGSRPGQPSPDFTNRWQHAAAVCAADPRYRLGRLDTVAYSDPARGTRAWVTWNGAQGPQDVWLQNAFPQIGSWIVVTGAPGSGQPGEPAFHVDRVHDVIS
jgi:hypothetical protein